MRRENGALTVKPKNRSVNIRLLRQNTDIVRKIASRKIIRSIDNNVVILDHLHRVLASKQHVMQIDLDVRIDGFDPVPGGVQFFAANVVGTVQNLALQIRKIDDIEIDEAYSADTGGGKVKRNRRT